MLETTLPLQESMRVGAALISSVLSPRGAAAALHWCLPFLVLAPLGAGMLTPILAGFSGRAARGGAGLALGLNFLLAVVLADLVRVGGTLHYKFGGWAPPWGIEYVLDPVSAMMAVLIAGFAFIAFPAATAPAEDKPRSHAGTFAALYLLLTAGLMGIVLTGDLFNLFVFLEIASLSAYALVAAGGKRATVAAFRYLIIGTIGGTFWVLGLGYLYALTGTLNMADMAERLPAVLGSRAAAAGLSFMVAGLVIKMAMFPLHGWQPDAYSYAPSGTMPFISAVMAKVAVYALYRLLYDVFLRAGPAAAILEMLSWTAALSILAGSILALRQNDARRLLAYSSVAQIGYVVLGLGIGNSFALIGALLHIVNHALMKGCAFAAVGAFAARRGSADIRRFAGLGAEMPWTAAAFTVAALGIVGLPPTAGFFSKYYLLRGAISASAWPFAAVLAVSSLLSAVYFFRVIESLYLSPRSDGAESRGVSRTLLAPALVLAALILGFGIFNQSVVGNFVPVILAAGRAS